MKQGLAFKYDEGVRLAIWTVLRQSLFNEISEYEMKRQLKNMGFEVDLGEMEKFKMPDLNAFVPRMKKEFTDYVNRKLYQEDPAFFTPERLKSIVTEVNKLLSEKPTPNMAGVLDLAKQF